MWHAPNQRVRAIANSKKRERSRLRKPVHIKRVMAHLELQSSSDTQLVQADVRLVLNDLSMKGVGVFSPIPLIASQEVTLSITDPQKIKVRAKVIWCQEHAANSHILSNQPYSFRIGLEFILSPDEEQLMKSFFEDVSKNHLYTRNT